MKRYSSFDSMRFIASFLVVALHAPFPASINYFIEPLTRCAVPFFFMLSGFFMFNEDNQVILQKTKKQIRYLFKIFLISWSIYFIWWSVIEFMGGNSVWGLITKSFNIRALTIMLFFNKPFVGDFNWYLLAMIYVLICYMFLAKINKQNLIWIWIIPGIFIYLIFGKYSNLFFEKTFDFYFVRNFLFDGVPYFALGNWFAIKQEQLKKVGNDKLSLFFAIFYIGLLIEKTWLIYTGNYVESHHYLLSNGIMVIIFVFCINNPVFGSKNKLNYFGVKYSLYIYLTHLYFKDFIEIGLNKFHLVPTIYNYIAPLIIFTLSFMASVGLCKYIIKNNIYKQNKNIEKTMIRSVLSNDR